MKLGPYFRCTCGKLHLTAGLSISSVCPACDVNLFDLIYDKIYGESKDE